MGRHTIVAVLLLIGAVVILGPLVLALCLPHPSSEHRQLATVDPTPVPTTIIP